MVRLKHLKNKHNNEKCVIIGGGPSIQELINQNYPFEKLKDNYIIIGCNVSYKILQPHYLLFLDRWFWNEFHRELKELKNTIKLTPLKDSKLKTPLPEDVITVPTECIYYPLLKKDAILCNNTGSAALSFAHYLNLKEIYLFGIDTKVQNDKYHFHDEYINKNKQPNDSAYKKHYENLKYITKNLQDLYKKNIYSCSSISSLNQHIKYVDPYSIL